MAGKTSSGYMTAVPRPPRCDTSVRPSAELGATNKGLRPLEAENEHLLAKEVIVALLIVLALIVALFIGLGFVVKWLFIIAVIAALVWLIAFFTRGARA